MKRIILTLFLFVMGSIYFLGLPSQVSADPRCITFKVKVTASNWPANQSKVLQVGCPGDRGPQCTGQIKNIRVGASDPVVLGKCSCFPNDNGCLKLGKKLVLNPVNSQGKKTVTIQTAIPTKCKITNREKICGTNGQTVKGTFRLSCNAPSKTPTKTPTPTTPGETVTPTFTPTPSICVDPGIVPNVRVSCPNCNNIPTPLPIEEEVTE